MATVVVTFWTANANLVPTVILLGSFLVPGTVVIYVLEHHADQASLHLCDLAGGRRHPGPESSTS